MARCKRRACDFRHAVIIQSASPSVDTGGGRADPWASPVVVANARACIEPIKGFERLRAMQLEASVTHKITIRYRAGITAAMRIVFGSRLFNIRSVIDPDERKKFLELLAEEGVAT